MSTKTQTILEALGAGSVCIGVGALGYVIAGIPLAVAFVGIVLGAILIFLGNI
jgi:hypothetical protein